MIRSVCCWYCALLLWLSGASHFANRYHFYGAVLDYQLVSTRVASLIATTFPVVMLTLSVALVTSGKYARVPLVATALFGTVFVGAQIATLFKGISVDCGCFGTLMEREVGITSILIAASIVLCGVVGAIAAKVDTGSKDDSSLASLRMNEPADHTHDEIRV